MLFPWWSIAPIFELSKHWTWSSLIERPGLAHFDPPGARGCIDELRDARIQTGPLSKDLTEVVLTNNCTWEIPRIKDQE